MLSNRQLLKQCISVSGWHTVLWCIESDSYNSHPELGVLRDIGKEELLYDYRKLADDEITMLRFLRDTAERIYDGIGQ